VYAHYCGAESKQWAARRCVPDGKILTDNVQSSPTDTTTAGDILSKNVTVSARNLFWELRDRGRKRAHGETVAGGKKKKRTRKERTKFKRAARKIINLTSFLNFTSVTLQQPIMSAAASTEIASFSSEFDIFEHRPIQKSVFGTTEFEYKSITLVH